MKITCSRSAIIDLSDPMRILGPDITCGKVAGVPTILLRPEVLLQHKDRVRDHIEDMVEDAAAEENARYGWGQRLSRFVSGKRGAFGRAAGILPGSLANAFNRASTDAIKYDLIVPMAHITRPPPQPSMNASHYGPELYQSSYAAIVTMAPMNLSFGSLFDYQNLITRIDCPRIDPGMDIFHFLVACHEIGHVAGGAEAQADKISALLTRRAYGPTPAINMLADFRAIETTMTAVSRLKCGNPSGVEDSPYGWEMVEALDDVSAMPQHQIDALYDEDIFDNVFAPYPRDTERSKALVGVIFNALSEQSFFMKSCHVHEIAQAAERAMAVTTRIGDPLLHRMTMRLALAAHRVTAGNRAYRFQL